MTPLLLLHWRRRAAAGRDTSPAQQDGDRRADRRRRLSAARGGRCDRAAAHAPAGSGCWRSSSCSPLGELYILPTGLGLFARLAPPTLGATTVAAWFLAIVQRQPAGGHGRHVVDAARPRRFLRPAGGPGPGGGGIAVAAGQTDSRAFLRGIDHEGRQDHDARDRFDCPLPCSRWHWPAAYRRPHTPRPRRRMT